MSNIDAGKLIHPFLGLAKQVRLIIFQDFKPGPHKFHRATGLDYVVGVKKMRAITGWTDWMGKACWLNRSDFKMGYIIVFSIIKLDTRCQPGWAISHFQT